MCVRQDWDNAGGSFTMFKMRKIEVSAFITIFKDLFSCLAACMSVYLHTNMCVCGFPRSPEKTPDPVKTDSQGL